VQLWRGYLVNFQMSEGALDLVNKCGESFMTILQGHSIEELDWETALAKMS